MKVVYLVTVVLVLWVTAISNGNQLKTLWHLGIDSSSIVYLNDLKVALASGKQFDFLFPVISHNLNEPEIPGWLRKKAERNEVLLFQHSLSFYNTMHADQLHAKQDNPNVHIIREGDVGTYFRLDFPNLLPRIKELLEERNIEGFQYESAFYTDVDVILQSNFELKSLGHPKTFMMGPEALRGSQDNAGVLYYNISFMKETLPALLDYAHHKLWSLNDQQLLKEFYVSRNNSTLLPDEYNWKPYWGLNLKAKLIHFHGPKPGKGAECVAMHPNIIDAPIETCFRPNSSLVYHGLLKAISKRYNVSGEEMSKAYAYYMSLYFSHIE